MENIFSIAEKCLYETGGAQILPLTHQAKHALNDGYLSFQSNGAIKPIDKVVFPEKPEWMAPHKMPKRRLNSDVGRAAFFHALAHIEWVAIYLAWDIIYRFRDLPDQFYHDWLTVADEEASHFELLRQHLLPMGCDYGDLSAHGGLWEHAVDTADDLLARLAIVPRCMEARGLDVTPDMIKKFEKLGDAVSVDILKRILEDEVGHVERGSYWFKFICKENAFDFEQKYQQLLIEYFKGLPKGPFNREMRLIAGFSQNEIDWLENRVNVK